MKYGKTLNPNGEDIRVSVRIERTLKQDFADYCKKNHISASEALRNILKNALQTKQNKTIENSSRKGYIPKTHFADNIGMCLKCGKYADDLVKVCKQQYQIILRRDKEIEELKKKIEAIRILTS